MTSSWTASQTLTHGMAMNPAMARMVGKFHKWAQQDAVREEDYEEIEASAFARIGVSRRRPGAPSKAALCSPYSFAGTQPRPCCTKAACTQVPSPDVCEGNSS